jgi:hypothetical protein
MGMSVEARREIERRPARVLLKWQAPLNAFMVRRDAIGATRFPDEVHQGEDWMFWIDLAVKGCRFRLGPDARALVRRHAGNAGPSVSAGVAGELVLERVQSLGREEAFLATARLAHIGWLERSADRWRLAARQAAYPDLFLKYGGQLLARRIFRIWSRVSADSAPRRHTPMMALPSRSPRSSS